jgi:phosphonate transport system substrate-binding protein
VRRLRAVSFLGQAARPHYEAVSALAAARAGVEIGPLEEPGLHALAAVLAAPEPALLFVCGLPYVRARDAGAPIELLAAPVSAGGERAEYFADLVLRDGLDAASADDLDEPLMAYNGDDSMSGWVLPRASLAPRGLIRSLYARTVHSGSHRASLALLLAGEADCAAIDSSVLALEARDDAGIAALRVVERFGPAPSPPVALVGGTPAAAAALRAALCGLHGDAEGAAALALGLVERFEPVSDVSYDPIRAAERTCATLPVENHGS